MPMTIARAARAAEVGVETIRFYERRGLIRRPPRPVTGFRVYNADTVTRIRFIRQAQMLGFSLGEIGELLSLRADPDADCAAVRAQAIAKRNEVALKIAQLQRIRAALDTLIANCPGSGALGACTILDAIEQVPNTPSEPGLAPVEDRSAADGQGAVDTMKTTTFAIEGMYCDGCARTIEALVGAENGVHKAEASFPAREARILYDPRAVSEAVLAAAIERGGFRVRARAS